MYKRKDLLAKKISFDAASSHIFPRTFIFKIWYVGWWSWSLGISLDIHSPNIEIHLPVIFIRFGFSTQINPTGNHEWDKKFGFFNFPEINKIKIYRIIGWFFVGISLGCILLFIIYLIERIIK